MSDYDVIVIGSGAGGGTLVHRLAPLRQEDPAARARGLPDSRAAELAGRGRLCRRPLPVGGHLVRRQGQGVRPAGALLRRRRDQDVRRGALPPARRGLRRGPVRRRRLAGLAHLLRRDGALLHAGGGALPGARCSRRGPHRAPGKRSLSLPGRLPRAAHPAALRRSRRRRLPALPRSLRGDVGRGEHALQRLRPLRQLRWLSLPGAREVRRRGDRGAARARARERHAADERRGGRSQHRRRR